MSATRYNHHRFVGNAKVCARAHCGQARDALVHTTGQPVASDLSRARALTAGQTVVEVMYWALIDNGHRLSCAEAEAMAALFRAYGRGALADAIIQSHAHGDDDPDDEHFGQAVTGTFTDAGFLPGEPEIVKDGPRRLIATTD